MEGSLIPLDRRQSKGLDSTAADAVRCEWVVCGSVTRRLGASLVAAVVVGGILSVSACGPTPHKPLDISISGNVLDVAQPNVPFNGQAAAATLSVVDIGVVFVGPTVNPLATTPIAADGTFVAPTVDVALTGTASPLLAVVDDNDTTSGPECNGHRLGRLYPTISGIAASRPTSDASKANITNALTFAMPTIVARLLTNIAASGQIPISVDALLCQRGFIFGFVVDMSQATPTMVQGAVVTPPPVVDGLLYLDQDKSGNLVPATTNATTALGAFIAWYGSDFKASETTDFNNFTFTATAPSGNYEGMGFALPGTAFVAALLPSP